MKKKSNSICPKCGLHGIFSRYSDYVLCERCVPEWFKKPPRFPDGYVYFVASETGPIKIGFGAIPEARYRAIQCNSPVQLTLIAVEKANSHRERQLHWKFRKHRLHGEWFKPAPETLKYIENLEAE